MKILGKRLILTKIRLSDVDAIMDFANDQKILETTAKVGTPFPCSKEYIESWIRLDMQNYGQLGNDVSSKDGNAGLFTILLNDKEMIGVAELKVNCEEKAAELEYFIGKEYWSQGYCTEVIELMLNYGFENLALHNISVFLTTEDSSLRKELEKIKCNSKCTLRNMVKKIVRL